MPINIKSDTNKYKEKYLKYKHRYLELKKHLDTYHYNISGYPCTSGGGYPCTSGGGYPCTSGGGCPCASGGGDNNTESL